MGKMVVPAHYPQGKKASEGIHEDALVPTECTGRKAAHLAEVEAAHRCSQRSYQRSEKAEPRPSG